MPSYLCDSDILGSHDLSGQLGRHGRLGHDDGDGADFGDGCGRTGDSGGVKRGRRVGIQAAARSREPRGWVTEQILLTQVDAAGRGGSGGAGCGAGCGAS